MSDYIYIIKDTGKDNIYKIGVSKNPQKRVKQLQTGNCNSLKLIFEILIENSINAYEAEKIIHNYLKENNKWKHGEWFELKNDDDVVKLAKTMLCLSKNNNKKT